jgi:hypothetical protein
MLPGIFTSCAQSEEHAEHPSNFTWACGVLLANALRKGTKLPDRPYGDAAVYLEAGCYEVAARS